MSGIGRIYRRNQIWWVDYSYRGKRFRESSRSTRKKDAKDLLRKRTAEIGAGRLIGPDEERLSFDDLCEIIRSDYKARGHKSSDRLEVSLKALRGFFGLNRAVEITTGRVDSYIAYRKDQGRANSTIRNEVNALRRALSLAKQQGKIRRVPHMNPPTVRAVRKGFFSRKEFNAVHAHLPEAIQPVALFGFLVGWRKSEILGLTWPQVDLHAETIRLEPGTTKNNEGREIPYRQLPELRRLILQRRAETSAVETELGETVSWVFHRNGKRIRSFRRAWASACEKGGMPGAWFHDLRRSAVRNMERAGVPRSVAMKITGHKTESVYRRYAIADNEAIGEGMKKLALIASPESQSEPTD